MTPEQMSRDSAFHAFADATLKYLHAVRPDPVRGPMPSRDRLREVLSDLRGAQDAAGSGGPADPAALAGYLRLVGLDEDENAHLIVTIHAAARDLVERAPDLRAMEAEERAAVFLQALAGYEGFVADLSRWTGAPAGALAAVMAGENPDDTSPDCKTACLIAFGKDIAEAVAALMGLLAACAALLFPVAAVLCAGVAFILYFVETSRAQKNYDNCLEDCAEA